MDLSFFSRRKPATRTLPRSAQSQFDEWRGQCIGIWADIESSLALLHGRFVKQKRINKDKTLYLTGAVIDELCKTLSAVKSKQRPENRLHVLLEELRPLLSVRNRLAHATGSVSMHGEQWVWAFEMRTTNPSEPSTRDWLTQAECRQLKADFHRLRQAIQANTENLLSA